MSSPDLWESKYLPENEEMTVAKCLECTAMVEIEKWELDGSVDIVCNDCDDKRYTCPNCGLKDLHRDLLRKCDLCKKDMCNMCEGGDCHYDFDACPECWDAYMKKI